MTPSIQIARRRSDRRPRTAVWRTWPSATPINYHVYANTGVGDPINYTTPIGTTNQLSYTTGPLTIPGTWSFGVRAFDVNGEEQNLEAAVTIVLSAAGTDATNLPAAPIGLGAFATAGGTVRVQWTYPQINTPAKTPTGFNLYIGLATGPLSWSSRSSRASRTYSGSVWQTQGLSLPGRSSRRNSGSQSWQRAMGGSPNYSVPAATVLYASSIAGTFVANLGPLSDGATYAIGVRAYNATAEEPNMTTVTVTADATGPTAVLSLTAAAVV